MEIELKDLLDSIKEQRLKFHALNYFTTQQLLKIRHQLGNLKQDSTAKVTPQLHSLLSTFTLHITSNDIKNVVEMVCLKATDEKQDSINKAVEGQFLLTAGANIAIELDQNEHETVCNEGMDAECSQHKLKVLIENLSKEEEELFEQLLDLEYSDIVCYNAVKQAFSSNSGDKLTDAMTWCFENAGQYNANFTNHGSHKSVTFINKGPSHKDTQLEVDNVPPKEDININHVVVQKLIQLNITPELAIKGAGMFDGDFKQAFEWCSKSEKKNTELLQQLPHVSVIPVAQLDVAENPVR